MRYSWLLERFQSNDPVVYYCDLDRTFAKKDELLTGEAIDYLLTINDSVVIFDEVAAWFPSRGSAAVSTKHSPFLKTLNQIRHRHIFLLVTTQSHSQIDSAIRQLAEETFSCAGLSTYSEKLKGPELFFKSVSRFTPENYDIWVSNARLRRNPLKSRLMRNKSFSGFLTKADYFLFRVYSSFSLLHFAKPFTDSINQYVKASPYHLLNYSSDLKSDCRFSWMYIPQYIGYDFSPCSSLSHYFFTKIPAVYIDFVILLRDLILSKFGLKIPEKFKFISFNRLNAFEKCLVFLGLICLIMLGAIVAKHLIFFIFLLLFGVFVLPKLRKPKPRVPVR